jgi:hypothetical protein
VRVRYGASPLHLLAHLAVLALAAWALLQVFGSIEAGPNMLVWLAGAVILHDLALLPAYSALDRLGARTIGGAVNYVRVPGGLSLLLLLAFLPVISGQGNGAFRAVSGQPLEGYLGRWLLATAVLFLASGAVFLVRSRAGSR